MADLAVSSECRGQGLGRRLVERLEEVVQEWGYDEVVLLVEATNFQVALASQSKPLTFKSIEK